MAIYTAAFSAKVLPKTYNYEKDLRMRQVLAESSGAGRYLLDGAEGNVVVE